MRGISLLKDISVGQALFDQSLLGYLMYLPIPVTFFVVFRTPFGLRRFGGRAIAPAAIDKPYLKE